jgi:hypothetical protein
MEKDMISQFLSEQNSSKPKKTETSLQKFLTSTENTLKKLNLPQEISINAIISNLKLLLEEDPPIIKQPTLPDAMLFSSKELKKLNLS